MSLAERLYRIGECVDDSEFAENLKKEINNIDNCRFIAISIYVSLKISNRFCWNIIDIGKVDKERIFITGQIGGSGQGTFYLYPNIMNQNKQKAVAQLLVSLEKSVLKHVGKHNRILKAISTNLSNSKEAIFSSIENIVFDKNTILVAFINDQTFYEKYPEILSKHAGKPVSIHKDISNISGISMFENMPNKIGYKAEINFFNTDNYHKNMSREIVEKIPLSESDGAYLNKGWLFCDKQGFLKKKHERLKYYILPNSRDKKLTKELVDKIKNSKTIQQVADDTGKDFIEELKEFSDWLLGNKHSNLVTFDIIFYEDNQNQREIFGTIQDVAPSKINKVRSLMYDFEGFGISDKFHRVSDRDKETIYLVDYFCKNALWAKLNNSEKDSKQKYKRFLANERIFLASLLLGRQKISVDELLKIINRNVNYGLERKNNSFGECKKMTDEGVKSFLAFPKNITIKHRALIRFLKHENINAIKE